MKYTAFGVYFLFILYTHSFAQYHPTDTLSYYSEYFKTRRNLKISLPSDYANNPEKKYNLIFLFDAQSPVFYEYTKATLAVLYPDKFGASILIGVENSDRHFEYLPRLIKSTPGADNLDAGGADTFALSIEKELKPFLENRYRTTKYSIGIGHSLGGTFVTYLMLKFPQIFNAGICISPNYVYDKAAIFSVYKDAVKRSNLSQKLFYLAYGKEDEIEEAFRKSTIKMSHLFREDKNENFYYKVDALNNTNHSTTALEGFLKGLLFINDFMTLSYEKFKPILDKNNPENFIGYVKKYFETQSNKTGLYLPSIDEINKLAYMVFFNNGKKEGVLLLDWGISLYPDNINLYDSMGELQEISGNIEKAKYFYNKGLSVAEVQKDKLPKSEYDHLNKWFKQKLENVQKKITAPNN